MPTHTHFGEHITLDGYGGDKNLLADKDFIMNFLQELPPMLDMNILMAPQVVFAPDNGKHDPGGWSGFVIIAESHISIHTFPDKGFVTADVYTCKNGMDLEKIERIFTEKFKLTEVEKNFIIRGKRYHSLVEIT